MTRYHFHIAEPSRFVEDPDGVELLDLAAAQALALHFARDVIAQDVRETGLIPLDLTIEVGNGQGETLHRLIFTEAVTIRR